MIRILLFMPGSTNHDIVDDYGNNLSQKLKKAFNILSGYENLL